MQQSVKSKGKGNKEQHIDDEKFQKRVEYTCEHHNVYSKLGKLSDEQN